MTPSLIATLFAAALIAGFVDTLAGGGGLITIPALLLANLPPVPALATNKVQSVSGTLTATIAMIRKGLVSPRASWPLFVSALCGSILGTIAVQRIPARTLDAVVPVVLLVIAVYFALSPKAGVAATQARIGAGLYRFVVVPLIGFYDGMFGPGTGSFFCMSAVALRGATIIDATAMAKFLNCATNAASAVIFIASGRVVWAIAAAMIAGQVLGAVGGSYAVTRGGTKVIRPLIVTVCVVMLGRYAIAKHLFGLHL